MVYQNPQIGAKVEVTLDFCASWLEVPSCFKGRMGTITGLMYPGPVCIIEMEGVAPGSYAFSPLELVEVKQLEAIDRKSDAFSGCSMAGCNSHPIIRLNDSSPYQEDWKFCYRHSHGIIPEMLKAGL